jgi:hypothetical protein
VVIITSEVSIGMRKTPLKTYREKPLHLNVRATEAMSFRALPEIKINVKNIAEIFNCSMTVVILKALHNYSELLQAAGVIGNTSVHDPESAVSFAERNGG